MRHHPTESLPLHDNIRKVTLFPVQQSHGGGMLSSMRAPALGDPAFARRKATKIYSSEVIEMKGLIE